MRGNATVDGKFESDVTMLSVSNIATVAELLGHTSTRMVSKVYGHLDQHKQHLMDAVAKAAARRFGTGP